MRYKGELESIVLGVLQGGPGHGYEIVKRVKALSEGALAVGEAKLYPCLHKLEADGLVHAEWVPQEGKPARKVYSLTKKGFGALTEKRKAWELFSAAMSTVMGTSKGAEHGR